MSKKCEICGATLELSTIKYYDFKECPNGCSDISELEENDYWDGEVNE